MQVDVFEHAFFPNLLFSLAQEVWSESMSGAVDHFAFDKMNDTWERRAGQGIEMPGGQVVLNWRNEDHEDDVNFCYQEVVG